MKLPDPIQFLRSMWQAAKFWWLKRRLFVSPEDKRLRLEDCQCCPYFLIISRQCGKCTCFVDAKASLASEVCPASRWRQLTSPWWRLAGGTQRGKLPRL